MTETPGLRAWTCGGAAALALALAAPAASAGPHRFEFRLTPFMSAGEAGPAARAYVAAQIRPGMPLAAAIRAAEAADARCRRPDAAGAPVVCSYVYANRKPMGDLDDVEWRIEILPGPGATVASADVSRIRHGL